MASSHPGRPDLEVEPVAPIRASSPTMASPTGSLISTPFVTPEPAYIAAKEAAFIITREVLVEFHQIDETDFTQMQETSLSQVSQSAITNVNAFLDRILLNILSNARSLSLVSLRPAVRDVLRPKLAQEAIDGADEELIECIGEDDDSALFEDAQESQDAPWDLELAWKRARLRCMVYTRLGDMEEEDEERYVDENGLDNYNGRPLPSSGGMVSPPVAIWLAAILEFIGENVLMVAGHAAYRRCENKYGRGIAGQALHPSVVLVGDNDLEKIALSPVLGRLWRAWRKPIRSPKTSISRALSIDSMRHRRVDSRSSTTGLTRKTSSETLSSLRPEPGSQRGSLVKESPTVVDPATIALPMSEHDIHEIEIPWFNAAARDAGRPKSILLSKEEEAMLAALSRMDVKEGDGEHKPENALRRMRSGSFPSTKWDFAILHPKDILMPEKKEEEPSEASEAKDKATEVDAQATTENSDDKTSAATESSKRDTGMSATLAGPDEFPVPVEVPEAVPRSDKRISTISQRRRSKRWSYRSDEHRKSQVSDVSEGPNGPSLFSRNDYKVVEPRESGGLRVEAPPNAPDFNSNVIAPTPVAPEMPRDTVSEVPDKTLSPPKKSARRISRDLSGYESGEVSPLEPSDDEGSGSITGLRDAQEHMSVPMRKSASMQRASSGERTISPILEAQYDDAPVSPISPDEESKEKRWHAPESADVSPVEVRQKPVHLPATRAPQSSTTPAVAPAPIQSMAGANTNVPAAITTQPFAGVPPAKASPPARVSQTMNRSGSDDRRRDGMIASPDLVSPDHLQKGMPDIPKEAQFDKLAAAAAAHANVAVPTPGNLYHTMNQPQPQQVQTQRSSAGSGSGSRESYERVVGSNGASATAPLPRVPAKDASPAPISRQLVRDRAVAPPSDSVITSVTPVPAPLVVGQPSNAPQFRKPVSGQASNAPSFSKPAPAATQPSNAPQFNKAPAASTQLNSVSQTPVHRKELSQDSRPGTGHGVTPLNLGNSPVDSTLPASALLERRRQGPPVDTISSERAGVQRLPSPTSTNDSIMQFPTKSVPETMQNTSPPSAMRRKPASRNQSKSGEELLYGDTSSTSTAQTAKGFDQLIDSNETLQYTLTPQNLRERQLEQWQQENNKQSTKNRSNSKTFAGIPVKIPWNAIRSSSQQSVTKSGLAPRDPKSIPESIRDLADFMRTTGPDPSTQSSSVRTSASMNSGKPLIKRGPQPIRNQDIMAQPKVASMPSGARSPTGTSMRGSSSGPGSRRSKPLLVARDAQASGSGMSDLIDFMREGGPSPHAVSTNGPNRMASGASYGGSMNSTQESFAATSVNSRTGLLPAGGRSSGAGPTYNRHAEEPMMPARKSRKPRDPYAIDDDDDYEILEEEEVGGANEDSLADFLRGGSGSNNGGAGRYSSNGATGAPGGVRTSVNGGGLSSHPPRVSSAVPNNASPAVGLRDPGATAGVKKTILGRPAPPGGVPSRQSLLQSRGGAGGGGDMSDLAAFLKNEPPPPTGVISRIPEEEPRRGGLFGRRPKV